MLCCQPSQKNARDGAGGIGRTGDVQEGSGRGPCICPVILLDQEKEQGKSEV
jgi:hypothetical protein